MPPSSETRPLQPVSTARPPASAPAKRFGRRSLKLLHVVTVPLSLRFLRGQTQFVRQSGFEVHTVSAPGSMVQEYADVEGATTHTLNLTRNISPATDAVELVKLWRLIRRLRPDIVHAHTPKGGLLGTVAARLAGVPVRIYQARGLRLATAKGFQRTLLTATERIACALATDVLCNSHSLRDDFLRLRLCRPDKMRILGQGSGNGVDALMRFNPQRLPPGTRSQVRARHAIPEDAQVIGFVGRLVHDKGIVELASAWQSLRTAHDDLHLLLVGPFEDADPVPGDVRENLERDPRVHLVPFTENIVEYYAAMDVLALPTYREGFANALLEAGAMALPCVASRVTGCVDPIQDKLTGLLVAPRDAGDLAQALARYLQDPNLREAHGAAARQRMLEHYAQQPLWQALVDFYDQARTRPRQTGLPLLTKQLFDKAVAASLLIATSPIIGATALAVALSMGRPVLFKQQRVGHNAELFHVYKFRSMRDALDKNGQPLPDAKRLTKVGQVLRRLSLDELPQLYNVLCGEMSLVGPRPLLVQYLERYSPEQARRHSVLPGITGWAAVSGRNSLNWSARFDHDLWYVDHWSLHLDLKILVRTLHAVFRRDWTSQPNHVTQAEFRREGNE